MPAPTKDATAWSRAVYARPRPKRARAKVLWLIKGLGLGGAEKLLSMAAPYLDRDRFEYEVGYFLPWKNALVENLQEQGLPVTCFDIKHGFSLLGFRRLVNHIRRRSIDVIHMHLPVSGVMGRLAGKLAGVPGLIYTEHNVWDRLHPVTRLVNRATLSLNDCNIAVSDDVRRSMKSKRAQQIATVRNGIACKTIAPNPSEALAVRRELGLSEDEFVIGKVANLTPKKNHELLLEAFTLFSRKFPKSRLVLVGQFAGREQHLRKLAIELGIEERVLLTGPRNDVLRVVQAFDVFAMSSKFEGLPIALLEAMSLEKPSVCTAVGGVPGVIRDGIEGFLVPAGRADLMADCFGELAANPSLRSEFGSAAHDRVRSEFDIEVMVRRIEDVYVRVLSKKGVERWT